MNRELAVEQARILKALIELTQVSTILDTFIPSFKDGLEKEDGMKYLHGNFNLGGTVSGRLSSSDPNLQNMPSTGTIYAKPIKKCFKAPIGWIMVGADYNALEAMIGALTTKDPNKLKVYTEGYDSHCLNAKGYFNEQMPDIDIDDVKSVNSIKDKYPDLRQKSKTITFAAQYGGTYRTFMDSGFEYDEAKKIEVNYHKLYEVSDKWVQEKLLQATKDGFITVAFGLKLRTPVLEQTILNNKKTPYEAIKEGRTAGNALGQSYGLLNNRSALEMDRRIMDSPYKYDIKPISQIHDSQYYLIKDSIKLLQWFNKNLIECMEWQELPELEHDTVKLGAVLEVFYPDWSNGIKIPNNASIEELEHLFETYKLEDTNDN